MKISRLKISKVIAEKTLVKFDQKALAEEIAAYLIAEGRTDELDSIIRDVIDYRTQAGIAEADITSAHPISDEQTNDLKKLIKTIEPKTTDIILNQMNDSSLIGGLKLNLANKQLDMTIRAKLNQFKQMTN